MPWAMPSAKQKLVGDDGYIDRIWFKFLVEQFQKIGGGIQVPSSSLPPGVALNITNDATCDSVDVDAVNTTVRVYGPGGAGSVWAVKRDAIVIIAAIPAISFTGKAYATDYYISYDTFTKLWNISTSYVDSTGDYMIRFHVRTHDANGVVGAGVSGGGGSAAGSEGGYGGVGAGSGGGHGALQ